MMNTSFNQSSSDGLQILKHVNIHSKKLMKEDEGFPKFWPASGNKGFSQPPPRSQSAKKDVIIINGRSANSRTKSAFSNSFRALPKPEPQEDSSSSGDWMKVLEQRSKLNDDKDNKYDEEDNPISYLIRDDDDDDGSSLISELFLSRGPGGLYTGESGSVSIGWADDAMESESTTLLLHLWEEIDKVFLEEGSSSPLIKPAGMSEEVYQEILLWRKAFPPGRRRKFRKNRLNNALSDHLNLPLNLTDDPLSSLQVHVEGEQSHPPPPFNNNNCDIFTFEDPSSTLSYHQGSSFVKSWLENLTNNFIADQGNLPILEEHEHQEGQGHDEGQSHHSLMGRLSLRDNEDNEEDDQDILPLTPIMIRKRLTSGTTLRVQRPISSNYLAGRGRRKPLSPPPPSSPPQETQVVQVEEPLPVPASVPEEDPSSSGSRRRSSISLIPQPSRRPSATPTWSRFNREEETNNLSGSRVTSGEIETDRDNVKDRPRQMGGRKRSSFFMNRLLFDENEEDQDKLKN